MPQTTDERIAERLIETLLQSKLLTESQARALTQKIAQGEMKTADWLALADYNDGRAAH